MSPISRSMKEDRSLALDVFRGLTMFMMVIVNNGVKREFTYPAIEHATWNGFTLADLIFPSFVFILGVAVAFVKKPDRAKGERLLPVYTHIIKRTLILFALGILFNQNPFDHEQLIHFRVMGVLQRLALVYLVSSILVLHTPKAWQAAAAVFFLALYWLIMKAGASPGFAAGDLSRAGNIAGHIDRLLLAGHLYKPDWDPEGILSTLPAIASGLIGVMAGHWLRTEKKLPEKIAAMMVAGGALIVAGLITKEWFPVNKNLWSPSFVLLCGGLDLQILGAMLWVIDYKGIKKWTGLFVVLGVNSITAYLCSDLLSAMSIIPAGMRAGEKIYVNQFIFFTYSDLTGVHFGAFLYSLTCSLFITFLMWLLYRKRIFIKI